MKWEPLALMGLLIGLGLWLVWGPLMNQRYDLRAGATTQKFQSPGAKGVVEVAPDPVTRAPTFRVLTRRGHASPVLTAAQFGELFGPEALAACTEPNPLFRLFNITSWGGLVWIGLGLGGQAAFSGRTLIQWIVSERHRKSVVPSVFWWLALCGGLLLFAYFTWRQDVVGVLGQAPGIVVYARNLRLIRKHARRVARESGPPAPPEDA